MTDAEIEYLNAKREVIGTFLVKRRAEITEEDETVYAKAVADYDAATLRMDHAKLRLKRERNDAS